jgi:hypothetical protein
MQARGIKTGKAQVMHLIHATTHDARPFPVRRPGTLIAGENA